MNETYSYQNIQIDKYTDSKNSNQDIYEVYYRARRELLTIVIDNKTMTIEETYGLETFNKLPIEIALTYMLLRRAYVEQ